MVREKKYTWNNGLRMEILPPTRSAGIFRHDSVGLGLRHMMIGPELDDREALIKVPLAVKGTFMGHANGWSRIAIDPLVVLGNAEIWDRLERTMSELELPLNQLTGTSENPIPADPTIADFRMYVSRLAFLEHAA